MQFSGSLSTNLEMFQSFIHHWYEDQCTFYTSIFFFFENACSCWPVLNSAWAGWSGWILLSGLQKSYQQLWSQPTQLMWLSKFFTPMEGAEEGASWKKQDAIMRQQFHITVNWHSEDSNSDNIESYKQKHTTLSEIFTTLNWNPQDLTDVAVCWETCLNQTY